MLDTSRLVPIECTTAKKKKTLFTNDDAYRNLLNTEGFENFDTKNEFEQLLINFTNESLQDTFNKQVFNNELKLYEEEGIEVKVSSCPDNTKCLLLLSEKPNGIIPRCELVTRNALSRHHVLSLASARG